MFGMIFGGRYVIMLMSIFSVYTGLIYNDCFAKSVAIFPSTWQANYSSAELAGSNKLTLNPSMKSVYAQEAYPFGLDPAWNLADNKVLYTNSIKMKISVIYALLHVIFGLSVNIANKLLVLPLSLSLSSIKK